jgi:hypothetical protein
MPKGRFLNRKLGKNVSRNLELLKSKLAGGANRKPLPPPKPLLPKKGNSREKP